MAGELIVNHERVLRTSSDHDARAFSYGDLVRMIGTLVNTLIVFGVQPGDQLLQISVSYVT